MSLDTTLAHAWQVFEHLRGVGWGKFHIAGSMKAGPTLSLLSMLGAALVSQCGMSCLKAREKNRREELRIKARDAVDQLLRAEHYVFGRRTISSPKSNQASHYPPEDAAILSAAVEDKAFLQLCAQIRGDDGVEKVRAVALFYSGLRSDALRHYVPDRGAGGMISPCWLSCGPFSVADQDVERTPSRFENAKFRRGPSGYWP